MSVKTLIFVPTYNERDNVLAMAEQLLALPLNADILFMDDASPDGTGEILNRLAAEHSRVSVVHRTGKLGIGSAHLDGIAKAYELGYDRLVTLDCDFTHKPVDVMYLLECAEGSDIAIGSRYLKPDSLPGWNLLRRSLTGLGHLLTVRLLGLSVDATGALRAYDLRRIPREIFNLVRARGYGFFFESMFVLIRNGYAVKEFPIVLPARTYGSSKMTVRETLRSATRLLQLWKENIVDSSRFMLPRQPAAIDSGLTDPQGWDSYWEDKASAPNRVYDLIATSYRVSVIRPQLRRFLTREFAPGSRLLHAGCGSGQVDQGLHGRYSISAVDISEPALRLYSRHNPAATSIRHATILNLPFPDESFDGVYNLGVVEHFKRSEIVHILREFRRVLKPGGKIVVFWPHARATSVAVLGAVHKILNRGPGAPTVLHPPEVSLLKSRRWAEDLVAEAGMKVRAYSFGPRDFFVQAVVVASKDSAA